MSRKIIITGGSGFIGRALSVDLADHGYDVIVLSRRPEAVTPPLNPRVQMAYWDVKDPATWLDLASGAFAIVNLAGDNIASSLRWTSEKKERILGSRLLAGRAVSETVQLAGHKPRVLIQASAIGYYGNRRDEELTEESGPGTGYLADVAVKWEKSIMTVREQGIRCATIRTGIVLGRGGGFLSRVILPFKFLAGGHPGNGRQWLSWIHLADEVGAIRFLIENDKLDGCFNLTAPEPVNAREFFSSIGSVTSRPSWLHPPAFVLKLVLGQLAQELLLSGQRVIPKRLLDAGYVFKYPDVSAALNDLIRD